MEVISGMKNMVNIFILLGPFSLLNDQVLITAVRVFTIFIYFISINLLINLFR